MAPRKHPQIITANRLDDGEVVYYTSMRRWSLELADAQILGLDDDIDTWIAAARADIERLIVVDVYPFDVSQAEDGSIIALSAREKIRALGPTVRLDLGKQAED